MHFQIFVVSSIVLLALLVNSVIVVFVMWPPQLYNYEQGIEYLWAARKGNNLVVMADYIDKASASLEGYHGNPCWLYPKVNTDLDVLRNDVRKIGETTREISKEGLSSLAYQQGIQNLRESLIENINHLNSAKKWLTTKSLVALFLSILAVVFAVPWLITLIAF